MEVTDRERPPSQRVPGVTVSVGRSTGLLQGVWTNFLCGKGLGGS